MASETSDLTFVRCPSCRSLVPASASRCRICNNPLDGLNKDEPDQSKAAGRVRQKTITASPQEVESVLRAAEAAEKPAPRAVSTAATNQANALADDLDPLGAYLQEMETGVGGAEPQAEATPVGSEAAPAAEDDDDLFDLDIFDEPLADEPVAEVPQAPDPAPVQEEAPVRPAVRESAADPKGKVEAPPPRATPAPERPREARPPQQAPQGPRPGGNSEQQRRPEQRPQQQQQQQRSERMQEQRQFKPGQGFQGRNPQPQQPQQRRDGREAQKPDRPPKQTPPPREQHERRESSHDRPVTSGPKTGKMRPGRLFGWLVSYENPDGRAIELREGKFFVTSSSIKGSDLILEDPSISTPHALMSVSEGGLLVQDLMSDCGVFFRPGDEDSYRREDSVIRVSHGDWIKFGDVEFLVIVVPASSR